MQGAFFFITTACFAIVERAPISGIGASASIAGRAYCIDHTSCVCRSVTKPGNPAGHFRLARASNGKPAIAAPSLR
jgi:hypothetical protein